MPTTKHTPPKPFFFFPQIKNYHRGKKMSPVILQLFQVWSSDEGMWQQGQKEPSGTGRTLPLRSPPLKKKGIHLLNAKGRGGRGGEGPQDNKYVEGRGMTLQLSKMNNGGRSHPPPPTVKKAYPQPDCAKALRLDCARSGLNCLKAFAACFRIGCPPPPPTFTCVAKRGGVREWGSYS